MASRRGVSRRRRPVHESSSTSSQSSHSYEREPFEDEPIRLLRPLAFDVNNFGSTENFQKFRRCNDGRNVLEERVFPADILADVHFPYTQRLREWGWYRFFSDTEIRPFTDVVKSFYFNGVKHDTYLESTFHKGRYRITTLDFVTALGGNIIRGNDHTPPPGFRPLEAARQVYRSPQLQRVPKTAKRLPLENRILHLMIVQALHPRQGNYSRVDDVDLYYMQRIINRQPFDIVKVIIGNVVDAMKKSKISTNHDGLPYGKLLTRIITSKVTHINEREVSQPFIKAPLALKHIGPMGWALDPNTNTWRRKEEIAAEAQIEAQLEAADEDFDPEQDEDEDENDGDTVELEHTESLHLDEEDEGGDETAEYAPPDVGGQAQAPVPPHELDDEENCNIFRGFVQQQRDFNEWTSMNVYSMRQELDYLITMQQHNYDSLGVIRNALNLAPQPPMPPRPPFDSPSSSHHTSPATSHPSANPDP